MGYQVIASHTEIVEICQNIRPDVDIVYDLSVTYERTVVTYNSRVMTILPELIWVRDVGEESERYTRYDYLNAIKRLFSMNIPVDGYDWWLGPDPSYNLEITIRDCYGHARLWKDNEARSFIKKCFSKQMPIHVFGDWIGDRLFQMGQRPDLRVRSASSL